MKKAFLIWLPVMVLVLGMNTGARATTLPMKTLTLLNDYELTHDIADVVHLGDQYISSFYRPAHQGTVKTFDFDLTNSPAAGSFDLYISHFQSNPELGYENHVYLNGHDLGFLGTSEEHWLGDYFSGDNAWLLPTGNVLTITAGALGGNYDDFEFTNLNMTYAAVPLPAAFWLLGSGLVGLLGFRRKPAA